MGRLAGLILDGSLMGKWAGFYFSNNKHRSLIHGVMYIHIYILHAYMSILSNSIKNPLLKLII